MVAGSSQAAQCSQISVSYYNLEFSTALLAGARELATGLQLQISCSILFSEQQNLSLNFTGCIRKTGLHNQSPLVCQVVELHVLNHLNTSSNFIVASKFDSEFST